MPDRLMKILDEPKKDTGFKKRGANQGLPNAAGAVFMLAPADCTSFASLPG
ncbi:MAG: hypothetical protein Q7U12_11070 [Undibacterium sp.]|nr:hypothetical protein [Undibacterium sp.]MDO8701036.1 hypothetical protein [Undibacterium sp.]MDO9193429.1 hypothetical protein [Undibacterium sp.]